MTSRLSLALQVVIVVLLALIWLKPQPSLYVPAPPAPADYSDELLRLNDSLDVICEDIEKVQPTGHLFPTKECPR